MRPWQEKLTSCGSCLSLLNKYLSTCHAQALREVLGKCVSWWVMSQVGMVETQGSATKAVEDAGGRRGYRKPLPLY